MRLEKIKKLDEYVDELKLVKKVRRDVNDKPFLRTESYDCYLNNGRVIPRERLIKGNDYNGAVIVMAITEEGEVLVVVEPRTFAKNGVGIGFISGFIEKDENIIEAAIRELREETGYTSNDVVLVDSYYPDVGCSSAYNYILIAYDCRKVFDQKLDEHEIIKYMSFSYEELFELEEMGYISGVNDKLLLSKSGKYVEGKIKDV